MPYRRFWSAGGLSLLVLLTAGRAVSSAEDWPTISSADYALKDCRRQPGAPAVYLYREEIGNPDDGTTSYFRRLKILTPAGRDRANIEIPVVKGFYKIKDLKARVVTPNGEVRDFTGQVFDKTALRAGRFKVTLKTFALPDVGVGSIIDYRYKTVPDSGSSGSKEGLEILSSLGATPDKPREGGVDNATPVFSIHVETWDIQEDLFTYKARFSYKPPRMLADLLSYIGKDMRLNWVAHQLPGRKPAMKDGRVELEMENIPAFEKEEFMTPESAERMEVRFFFVDSSVASPEDYWKREAKNWQKGAEDFMGKAGDVTAESPKIVSGITEPLEKLKALYARAQQIKNLSYDKTMTRERRKELKIKDNRKAADVLKRNYGWRSDITRTFVALARAAGFDARVVRVAMRDDKFFDKNLCGLYSQFDAELALVKVNDATKLFDPATPFCPVGLVRWSCMGTTCLCPTDKPPSFLTTPVYPPDTALTQREIALQLDPEGNLSGTVKVGYTGQEALVRRVEHIGDDDVEVKKDLEAELAAILPAGAKVSLKKVENMANSADTVWAHFEIAVPGIATAAGQRILLPASPLLGSGQHPFRHEMRRYPVYFPFPRREFNDIIVTLPDGMTVETAPAPRQNRQEFFGYSLVCAVEGGTKIHVQRDLVVKKSYFPVGQYSAVKAFFDQVRAGDEEQIVLSMAKK